MLHDFSSFSLQKTVRFVFLLTLVHRCWRPTIYIDSVALLRVFPTEEAHLSEGEVFVFAPSYALPPTAPCPSSSEKSNPPRPPCWLRLMLPSVPWLCSGMSSCKRTRHPAFYVISTGSYRGQTSSLLCWHRPGKHLILAVRILRRVRCCACRVVNPLSRPISCRRMICFFSIDELVTAGVARARENTQMECSVAVDPHRRQGHRQNSNEMARHVH